jgi:phosphatidylglycerophosphatase A
MTAFAVGIATALGAGYAPFAPGTVGSAVGVVVFLATRHLDPAWQITLIGVVTVVGVWASTVAARHFDREDPGHVVIDEVAGQLVTYALLDLTWIGVTLGFLLFRVFDIIKPWPAGRLEHLPGGWGIMADDLMAGIYGWLALWLVISVLPWLR